MVGVNAVEFQKGEGIDGPHTGGGVAPCLEAKSRRLAPHEFTTATGFLTNESNTRRAAARRDICTTTMREPYTGVNGSERCACSGAVNRTASTGRRRSSGPQRQEEQGEQLMSSCERPSW